MMKINKKILKCLQNRREFIHKKAGAYGKELGENLLTTPDFGSFIYLSKPYFHPCKMEMMTPTSWGCCESKMRKYL